jgi:hypothetical protein
MSVASKHAVTGLTKSAALEYGALNRVQRYIEQLEQVEITASPIVFVTATPAGLVTKGFESDSGAKVGVKSLASDAIGNLVPGHI